MRPAIFALLASATFAAAHAHFVLAPRAEGRAFDATRALVRQAVAPLAGQVSERRVRKLALLALRRTASLDRVADRMRVWGWTAVQCALLALLVGALTWA